MTEQEFSEMSADELINAFQMHVEHANSKMIMARENYGREDKETSWLIRHELLRRLEYYDQQNNSQIPMKEPYYG